MLAAIVLVFTSSIMTDGGIFVLLGSVILALMVCLALTFRITVAEALD